MRNQDHMNLSEVTNHRKDQKVSEQKSGKVQNKCVLPEENTKTGKDIPVGKKVTGSKGNAGTHENKGAEFSKGIAAMTDREFRYYKRTLRLERVRRQKRIATGLTLFAILAVVLTGAIFCGSVKAQANQGFKYYTSVTVEKGETLWSIADEYIDYSHYKDKDDYISEIERINHFDREDLLLAGRTLIVPYYSAEYVQ